MNQGTSLSFNRINYETSTLRRSLVYKLREHNVKHPHYATIVAWAEGKKVQIKDNYGKWHIDHIIECHRFDLTKPEEQRKCFHYSNQRPLWAIDNLSRKKS